MTEVRLPSELSYFEWLTVIKLSYSRISDFEMCPAKYFFNNIIGEPGLFNPPAVMGSIVHEVMEDHVGEQLDLDTMLHDLEEYREEYDPSHDIPDGLMKTGHQIITEFYDRHKDDHFDVIDREMAFEIIVGTGYIRGFIDLVLRMPDGSLKAVDYKAGKHEINYNDVSTNLQLGIYALALQKLFPDTPISVEMYYLRSGRRKGHSFTEEELSNVAHTLHQRVYEIIEQANFNYTQNTKICQYLCDFGKTGVCPRGASVLRNAN